jgi:hypothetical protein
LLISQGAKLNHPKINYPLINAIKQKKPYVADLLILHGCNVNVKDKNYLTPLLLSVYNELETTVQHLIDHGADINYIGAEGDNNPLSLMLIKGNDKIADILLENGFDTQKYNRDMNTPLHIAFKADLELKPSTISKLLYYGDLNIANINGETPLHLFMRKYNWINYNKILENKQLDIFIKDNNNKAPIDYVSDGQLSKFLDVVTNGFMGQNEWNCNETQRMKCINKAKEYIMKNGISYLNQSEIPNDVKLIISPPVTHGMFNSDVIHNVIYTTIILERNPNVAIPYRYYNKDNATTIMMLLESMNFLYNTIQENTIFELINIYQEHFFQIAPYLILWKNKNLYYIDRHLDYYTQKCLMSNDIRFIFFKLTLIVSALGTHANIIIYDKETGTLERFEPYGITPYLDTDELDNMLEVKLGAFLKSYNKNFRYYAPKDLFDGISFQIFSNDTSNKAKKMGDPIGFCLAWTFWYLEMRIKNPSIEPKTLIDKAQTKIKGTTKKEYRHQIFIDFIRNYATNLDKDKNKIMLSAGINEGHVYNMQFTDSDNHKIINETMKRITTCITKRI